jgi:hypothetical protein
MWTMLSAFLQMDPADLVLKAQQYVDRFQGSISGWHTASTSLRRQAQHLRAQDALLPPPVVTQAETT